jgi:hypothetical protein
MLLALEIWLTVKAFKSGWRWRVLWAYGAVLVVAVVVAAGSGSTADFNPAYLLIDVGLIAALAGMVLNAPARRAAETPAAPIAPDTLAAGGRAGSGSDAVAALDGRSA